MVNKKLRTMNRYLKAGAEMRMFKTLGARLITDISMVLSAADTDKLMRAMDKVDQVCSRAEDNMFRDHPQLTDQHIDVFYGSTAVQPRNEVDEKMIGMAGEIADELFKGTGH